MNPIVDAKKEFSEIVAKRLSLDEETVLNNIEYPPREEVGDLALPLPSVTKNKELLSVSDFPSGKFIKKIEKNGIYVNAFLNERELFNYIFSSLSENYGIEKVQKPERIVVEHTSANPIHPLHIGHLRNAILGDTISRLLKARGHEVNRRFYINDAGRQVAILALGYILLGKPEPPKDMKVDHWFGFIYSLTNILIEIRQLKEELKEEKDDNKYREKISKLDELVALAAQHKEKNPELFDKLADAINSLPDVESEIQKIIRAYESGEDEEIKKVIRKIVGYNIRGFEESLLLLDISFDAYDYESDLLWDSSVQKILQQALQISIEYKGTRALKFDLLKEVKYELKIPEGLEVPPLVLVRSDGTSLYTTRDIAYSIKKFEAFNADKVINVIAEQQSVPQMQLRAALYLLGYKKYALNLIHYSYGMVNLQGMRMSGRLGKFISLDEILEKVKEVAIKKIEEKGGVLENVEEIVNAAVRYAILSVSANKPVTFNINTIVNFEQNSGPYLQYTYARAYNILTKNQEGLDMKSVDYSDLTGDKRRLLILIAKFPEVFTKAVDELRPEDLIDFLRRVADTFNRWYNYERVLQEQDKGKRMTRLFLVKGVERVLYNGLMSIGIKPLQRM